MTLKRSLTPVWGGAEVTGYSENFTNRNTLSGRIHTRPHHRKAESDVEEVLRDGHDVLQVDGPAKNHFDWQTCHEEQQHGQYRVADDA